MICLKVVIDIETCVILTACNKIINKTSYVYFAKGKIESCNKRWRVPPEDIRLLILL